MIEIPVTMNAARVCNAISRIGYEPHSALMDVIDNAVAADALNVRVLISLIDGKTINQRNNVESYRIVDDGKGMDEEGIKNAFKLGSDENYKPNSLSKYGMGLKSAGFSLGTRIQIVSKKDGKLSSKYYLDRKVIEQKGYVICCEELTPLERGEYEAFLGATQSGTVLEITGCGEIYHTSAKTTLEKLKHRLGVTYYPFLSAPDTAKRLNITLTYPSEAAYVVQPLDILHFEEALPVFDPATYDASKPCHASRSDWVVGGGITPIKLAVMSFPKAGMGGNSSPLGEPEKEKVRSYNVSRENKGFFIYRNGRLIRWGDDLGGIVGRDMLGLRARMELTSEHDDLLHVDVSKQRLEMDDETRTELDTLMRLPRKQAEQIFDICDSKLKNGPGEGTVFSNTADSVPEEDPVEDVAPPDPVEKKQRAKKRENESKETMVVVGGAVGEEGAPVKEEVFRRVRYSDDLPGMNFWSTQKDPIQGTFVLVNRRHPFYQTIISNFDDSAAERLALEAFIFCCAVGENKTYENLTVVNGDDIRKVLDRYHTVLSYNLSEWANGNQHLFEK